MALLRIARILALAGGALCSAVAIAAADDRSICGSAPPKPDTVNACSRLIASPRTSPHDRALAYSFRAEAKRAKDDTAGAIADYGQAIASLPNFELAYKNRGTLYLNTGDNAHAIADFDMAVGLDPQDAKALYGRGLAKRGNGDAAGGDADVAAAKKLDPDIAKQP